MAQMRQMKRPDLRHLRHLRPVGLGAADLKRRSPVILIVPGDRSPFRKTELTDEQADASYHSKHDLREMYTRDNVERRRAGSHTLRRYLTVAQDKQFIAKALKIRDEYAVANNDDVVLVLVQTWMNEGKTAEIDPKLVEAAKKAIVPKRGA